MTCQSMNLRALHHIGYRAPPGQLRNKRNLLSRTGAAGGRAGAVYKTGQQAARMRKRGAKGRVKSARAGATGGSPRGWADESKTSCATFVQPRRALHVGARPQRMCVPCNRQLRAGGQPIVVTGPTLGPTTRSYTVHGTTQTSPRPTTHAAASGHLRQCAWW